MSRLREELATQRPDWANIPTDLERAWTWMEQRGFGREAASGYVLTAYPGSRVLGPVFAADASLQGWFEPGTLGYRRLLPIAEAAGDGSLLALWHDDEDRIRVVVLASDGEGYLVADSATEFVVLLAIGYQELVSSELDGPPMEEEAVSAVSDYRSWVESGFGVPVPDEWPPVGDDEFTTWLDAALGREPRASQPNDSTGVPELSVSGDAIDLLLVLGQLDGAEVAARVSNIVGVPLAESLKRSTKALRGVGIEQSSKRNVVETFWIRTARYPRPEDVLAPLAPDTTLTQAREILGEPEFEGGSAENGALRYVVSGRYLHLEFTDSRLTLVTLMAEAP